MSSRIKVSDYRSHHWDGQTIAVHKYAMKIDGGLELLRVERRVGILEDLMIRHLVARGRNPKEKPVERSPGGDATVPRLDEHEHAVSDEPGRDDEKN